MYRRSLPPFPDLSAFLAYLDSKDGVRTITAPVDMNLEITEVHRRVIAAGGPVLRFERAIAAGLPSTLAVVANLFGTRERVAAGLGTVPADLERLGAFMAWMRAPQPPKSFAEAGRLFPAARAALQSRPKFVSEPRAWADVRAGFVPTAGADLLARRRGAAHHLAHRHHAGAGRRRRFHLQSRHLPHAGAGQRRGDHALAADARRRRPSPAMGRARARNPRGRGHRRRSRHAFSPPSCRRPKA